MKDDLYILAATAVTRNGVVVERRIVLEYVLAKSRDDALRKIAPKVLEPHLPLSYWSAPIFGVEQVPASRIEHYCNQLRSHHTAIARLIFLWGYAAFSRKSSSLRCGTVIARTKYAAEAGVLYGPAKQAGGRVDICVDKVPTRLVLPRPPEHTDPTDIFRKKFSDIIKK